MEAISFGRRVGTSIYNTGIVVRALSSQTFTEKGFDITPEQFLILDIVAEYGELYQRQISEITLKDRGNVARLIKILEDKTLIEKEEASNGRRIYKIKITKKGEEVRNKIKPTAEEIKRTITENLSEDDLTITLNTLKKVYENARELVKLQI